MDSLARLHEILDFVAFVAVLISAVILILIAHATAELLTTVAATFGGVYSLRHRRSAARA